MKRLAIIYHKADFDGLMSFCILKNHAMKNDVADEIFSFGYNYNQPLPEGLFGFDKVWVADVSLPTEAMKRLHDEHKLVWIDHHRTSMSEAAKWSYDKAPGIRREGVGACELCWEWAMKDAFASSKEAPLPVVLLSAYDVFDKKRMDCNRMLSWDDEVLPFQWGMRNRYGLDRDELYADFAAGAIHTDEIIQEGTVILNYVRENGLRSAANYGFEVKVNKIYNALAILTDSFGSIPREQAAREAGIPLILCANRRDDGVYYVSVYSSGGKEPLDIGAYLKETYGGGGHPAAGGAQVDEKTFIRLITEKVF
jgi:hypothetical protein